MVEFKKAEKKQAKLRLAFTGPSGSGKTYSALIMASGIGKKIALIDTENHSASLYVGEKGIPEFDTVEVDAPYTVAKYVEAIDAAANAGYDVIIIDSISHAWAGEGGLLAQKEALDGTGRGSSYTNWASITKDHEKFKSWLLKVDSHIIATMRSKQDYVLETNDKGKQVPRKVGLAPIQRDGIEYEFTMVLDMAMNHYASVSKTRAASFDGRLFIPGKKDGQELSKWLLDGKAAEVAPTPTPDPTTIPTKAVVNQEPTINHAEQLELIKQVKEKNITRESYLAFLKSELGVDGTGKIKVKDYAKVTEWIIRNAVPAQPAAVNA